VFTQRQWADECAVANELRRRAHERPSVIDGPTAALIDVLVGPTERGVADQQRAAVESGLSRSLTIVAGGPGTGKTYTVARLLAALVGGGSDMRIGLAAPTGKAAARMTGAILHATSQIAQVGALGPEALSRLEACRAVTVHRLLGPDHRRTRFAHDATNPLPYDVVIVDETSMVALPLMARLIDAAAAPTRLVLVGDPDQLASIEAGTVLGDIVDAARSPWSPMADVVIRLDRQHRTTADSPIFALAEAIRDQRVDDVVAMLRAGAIGSDGEATLVFHEEDSGLASAANGGVVSHEFVRDVVGPSLFDLQAAAMAGDAGRALDALDSQRVLCAHRRGPYGVERWNETLESWMVGKQPRQDHPGRAVLATRNDLRTGIVNGDTGVLVARGGELRAVFRNAARKDGYARAELDHLELAYALTVHKSQGSEYDTVVLVHPPVGSPLIGRELLYTAVTRARRRLVVIATAEAVAASVCAPSRRVTGLTDALS
jgi:exodeoxyribonuclease V alpha subunit